MQISKRKPLNAHKPSYTTFDPFRILASKHSKSATLQQIKTQTKWNDENVNTNNLPKQQKPSVTKRIKKPSLKTPVFGAPLKNHEQNCMEGGYVRRDRVTLGSRGFQCYEECVVEMPMELKALNIEHKQDNDCDSDWDQVEAGANRLYRSLKERLSEGSD